MASKLTNEEEEFVKALIKANIPKNVGKALAYLAPRGETTSVEVEGSTGLRQPEVSIAMQELRNRGWVSKRDIKKEGKGRPVHYYKLTKPLESILEEIIKSEEQKIENIRQNIDNLKKYIDLYKKPA
ncbi:MAG: ArsR family transcriptional regulator [Thermoplasmata archaeon]